MTKELNAERRYEGHTHTKEWGDIVYADGYLPIFLNDGVYATDLDRELMADAPLLLAEVKKLRHKSALLYDGLHATHTWVEYNLLRVKNGAITKDELVILLWEMCNNPAHKAIVEKDE